MGRYKHLKNGLLLALYEQNKLLVELLERSSENCDYQLSCAKKDLKDIEDEMLFRINMYQSK